MNSHAVRSEPGPDRTHLFARVPLWFAECDFVVIASDNPVFATREVAAHPKRTHACDERHCAAARGE